ncbi:MAG: ABC transporter permease [Candidatus Dormibacteraceae bacterium]
MAVFASAGRPEARPSHLGLTALGVVRSEWTKFRSVRSTLWSLAATVFLTIGIGAAITGVFISRYGHLRPRLEAGFDPTSNSLAGIFLAQLAIGVLGVLVVSSEYASGMVRTTFAAVPQRALVLAAKAFVFGLVALIIGLASSFGAFFVGQSILSIHSLQASISDPGVLRAVIGGGLYLAVLGLIGLGLAGILRSTAAAIATLFGLVLVLPAITHALPQDWQQAISPYLPGSAGQALMAVHQQANTLSPWMGFAVFCAYAAAALVIAGVLMVKRDA